MSDGSSFIMEIRLNRESLAETRNGSERERKSVLRNVCVTSSGGQRHWFQSINAANIILNYIQRKKSGIILRMDF